MIKFFFAWTSLLLLTPLAFAQVAPATSGGNGSVTVGVEASAFRPDSLPGFTGGHVVGPGLFFDIDPMPRWGAEGEARWLHWHGSGGQQQSDYLLGPRYRLLHWRGLSAWAKFMMGAGVEKFPDKIASGSYFAYAPGATIVDRISSRLDLRIDYEYQFWPHAPNIPGFPDNGMHPSGLSLGIGYQLFGHR